MSILGNLRSTRPAPGDDPWRLHCAAHELGHMLVWQAFSFGIAGVTVTGFGDQVEGWTHLTDQGKNLTSPERCRLYLVGLLAGREADMRWARHSRRPFQEKHSKWDLREFQRIHRHPWVCDITVNVLRAQAHDAIACHWPQIVRMAPSLARKGSV
ncbi:hypothetical protein [Kutzneria albida]|uniref:Peptidase M41 domain-containing protein n=1 Tax=Kutzneria albida DSM 43870 TaxID=1449976 RepID=W5WBN8_9PSEU|nr:hypothetical protein [Kutzneria albida]AHH98292.1 hypothetical protein KALB_4930 [Kutzneria albida DSM 43870]